MTDVKRDLILPDQHVPRNDKVVWKTYLAIAEQLPFNNILTIGDFLNAEAVSSHPKSADMDPLEYECEVGSEAITQLTYAGRKKNPNCKFHFVGGNHDFRIENYAVNNASAFKNMPGLKIPYLLGLDKNGWNYVPYRQHLQLGNAYLTHDVGRKAGPTAHRASVIALHVNIIHGHTHRLAVQYEGSMDGIPRYGAMLGWGGDISAVLSYSDSLSARVNSVHGFGILYRWKDKAGHSRSRIDAVPVIDGTAVVEGRLFEAA